MARLHLQGDDALPIQLLALTAAWVLTGNKRFGQRAVDHLRVWSIAPET
jgi:hypothetical protein